MNFYCRLSFRLVFLNAIIKFTENSTGILFGSENEYYFIRWSETFERKGISENKNQHFIPWKYQIFGNTDYSAAGC